MVLLLIIPAWLLIVALVLGLCLAARRGDERASRACAPAPQQPVEARSPSALAPPHASRRAEQPHRLVGAGGTTG